MLIAIALILVGFFLLMWSADLLVDNASALAGRLGISTFLVGVIIIGFGTSAPEMFVSAMAALENKGNLALGNALGSNITNIGLVLGSAALIRTLPVDQNTVRVDIPIVVTVGLISVLLVCDSHLSNVEGFVLLILLLAYLLWSAIFSQSSESAHDIDAQGAHLINHSKGRSAWAMAGLSVLSIVLLIAASRMLVSGAITIAQTLGVSELIIGLTIIAVGTSLPELAAAVAAARKGVHNMIIGNIIGSNIFNTLGVLGIAGAIQATNIDTSVLSRDFPVMLGFTVLMFIFALTKNAFSPREGAIMLTVYTSYICYLILSAIR